MARSDRTSLGGDRSGFQVTHWSEIRDIGNCDDVQRRRVVKSLIKEYWKPIYCHLRRRRYGTEPAQDLTQGFFHEIVLGKNLLQQADETKGRFRSFLLTALDHYVTSMHRVNVAQKRYPKDGVISLEEFDETSVSMTSNEMSPEGFFTYIWATVLMDNVLAEVEANCLRDGKAVHWEVFRARVLVPIMNGAEPESVSELCKRLAIESKTKVSNMIVTVKRRLEVAMSNRVRCHVDSDEQIEQEIQT